MKLADFQAFSRALQEKLEQDSRVLGLVFLGSAAETRRIPDEFSDHDFFVITEKGAQEEFRQNLSWLPDNENIILNYRETSHGLKVIFANGHLIEFAIFDEEELALARVNDYRVALDKASIQAKLEELESLSRVSNFNPQRAMQGFLSEMLIGVRRCKRGEVLSGERFIKQFSHYHLMALLVHYLPKNEDAKLDNLDPYRRFEKANPELGKEIHAALLLESQAAAETILALAERELAPRMPDFPQATLDLIKNFISS